MSVADIIGQRSKCSRAKVGTVIVDRFNRVIATGYAGPPATMPVRTDSCYDWCERARTTPTPQAEYGDCVATHSEMNALLFGDKRDMSGGTLYCNGCICYPCAKVIANSGVERVVMRINRTDAHRLPERTVQFLRECLIEVDVVD
jgi:dCMP deaminase